MADIEKVSRKKLGDFAWYFVHSLKNSRRDKSGFAMSLFFLFLVFCVLSDRLR